MWAAYQEIARRYNRLTLAQERRLISRAQRGSKKSTQELVWRHIGFVMFRLRERLYPSVLWRLGDDLLPDVLLLLHEKVQTYNLHYRDRRTGRRKRVRFCSYVWKRVDGFIIDSVKRERRYVHGMEVERLVPDLQRRKTA